MPTGQYTLPDTSPLATNATSRLQNAAALLLLGAALTIILSTFNFGFKPTADERELAYASYTEPLSQWFWDAYLAAVAQGRISYLITMPLGYLGGIIGDFWFYPLLGMGIFAMLILSAFLWMQLLSAAPVALGLTSIYFALLPLGLHHWLPNAYITQFTPYALALAVRVIFLRYLQKAHFLLILPLALIMFLGALSFELCLALTGLMTLAEFAVWRMARRSAMDHTVTGRYVAWQTGVFVLAALVFLSFRLRFPSSYPGNQLPVDAIGDVLQSVALHIAYAPAFVHWFDIKAGAGFSANATTLACGVFVGATIVLGVWQSRPQAAFAWLWIAFGAAVVLAMAVPVGANGKYVDWCLNKGECSYVESRFSLIGIAIILLFGAAAIIRERRAWTAFAITCGIVGAATFVSNSNIRSRLDFVNGSDRQARAYACAYPEPSAGDEAFVAGLARSQTDFHNHRGTEFKTEYWRQTLSHLRRNSAWHC